MTPNAVAFHMTTSRTVVMEEPGVLRTREVELPELGPDDVLVRVDHNGICGTDVHMYQGELDVPFPVVPGHEFSGVVEALGDNVDTDAKGESVAEGDAVAIVPGINCGECWYCNNLPSRPLACSNRTVYGFRSVDEPPYGHGGMSELVVVEGRGVFYRLPDGMDVALGALCAPISTATHALERAYQPGLPHLRESFGLGKSVAVQGVGPVGLMAVAAANAAGAGQVIAIDLVPERLAFAEEFGATDTFNVGEYGDGLVEAVKESTLGGVGPDVIIGAAGTAPAVEQAADIVRNAGTYVEVGHYHHSTVEFDPGTLVQKELDIYGSLAYPPNQFETSIALLERLHGEVPFPAMFDVQVGLDDAEEAYLKMARGEALCATIHPGW